MLGRSDCTSIMRLVKVCALSTLLMVTAAMGLAMAEPVIPDGVENSAAENGSNSAVFTPEGQDRGSLGARSASTSRSSVESNSGQSSVATYFPEIQSASESQRPVDPLMAAMAPYLAIYETAAYRPLCLFAITAECPRQVPVAGDPAPGAPAAAPVVTTEVLVEESLRSLVVPRPSINIGPDLNKVAVNLWTWLWIDPQPAITSTAAAGGLSVTATATLSSVEWSMGEPSVESDAGEPANTASVVCDGAGVAPNLETYDWQAEPPCGYKYKLRSLPERTGGSGSWTLTATSNWNVEWQASTGETGTATLSGTATQQVVVGEYRTLLVDQPN